jgi:hypothetical protein
VVPVALLLLVYIAFKRIWRARYASHSVCRRFR